MLPSPPGGLPSLPLHRSSSLRCIARHNGQCCRSTSERAAGVLQADSLQVRDRAPLTFIRASARVADCGKARQAPTLLLPCRLLSAAGLPPLAASRPLQLRLKVHPSSERPVGRLSISAGSQCALPRLAPTPPLLSPLLETMLSSTTACPWTMAPWWTAPRRRASRPASCWAGRRLPRRMRSC